MSNRLSITSWNVNGLIKKLKEQEFMEMIAKYDIVCLYETWTTPQSEIDINGFMKYHEPSTSKGKGRKSGGIVVYVKSNVSEGVICTKRENNLIWIKLTSSYFGWQDDIYLAAVYCPPNGSSYNNNQLDTGKYYRVIT